MTQIYLELSEEVKKPKIIREKLLNVFDTFFSLFVVSPLVVGCWRGLWDLIEIYGEYFSLWECLITSSLITFLMNYSSSNLNEKFIEETKCKKSFCKTVKRVIIFRIYHTIFMFASIMSWRCLWNIVPTYWGESIAYSINVH